jgi:quercetin dioxygenase-like cupin family protein
MNLQRLLFVLLVLVIVGSASAQDTLRVNPDTVTLKFENDRVRVLESVLKPGIKENEHSHPDYVTYVISGGKVRNHMGGKISLGEFKAGEVLFRDARKHWSENIGKTTIRVIMFELKDGKLSGQSYGEPPELDPVKKSPRYYKVRAENNGGNRIYK